MTARKGPSCCAFSARFAKNSETWLGSIRGASLSPDPLLIRINSSSFRYALQSWWTTCRGRSLVSLITVQDYSNSLQKVHAPHGISKLCARPPSDKKGLRPPAKGGYRPALLKRKKRFVLPFSLSS